MRSALYSVFVLGCAVSLATTPMVAHHVLAAKFDPTKPVTLTGTVSKIDWLNPHVHIFMEVQDGSTFASW